MLNEGNSLEVENNNIGGCVGEMGKMEEGARDGGKGKGWRKG